MSYEEFDPTDHIILAYFAIGCLFKFVFPILVFALVVKWLFA